MICVRQGCFHSFAEHYVGGEGKRCAARGCDCEEHLTTRDPGGYGRSIQDAREQAVAESRARVQKRFAHLLGPTTAAATAKLDAQATIDRIITGTGNGIVDRVMQLAEAVKVLFTADAQRLHELERRLGSRDPVSPDLLALISQANTLYSAWAVASQRDDSLERRKALLDWRLARDRASRALARAHGLEMGRHAVEFDGEEPLKPPRERL